jgi:hypothetical protein
MKDIKGAIKIHHQHMTLASARVRKGGEVIKANTYGVFFY